MGPLVVHETSAALIATWLPGFFTPRFPPAPLWPQGSPQSQSYYDTRRCARRWKRLVDFDRINACEDRLSVGAVGVTTGNFKYFDNFEFRKLWQENRPNTSWRQGRCRRAFHPSSSKTSILGRRHRHPTRRSIMCSMRTTRTIS